MSKVTVILPQFGMGMTDGEMVKWLKVVGDMVTEGESLVEVEAAKSTVEVPSPASGKLVEIIVPEGQSVDVREPIAIIET